ncbi:hypothetical protein ACYAFX_20435 [Rhodococcus aetherivorans]
MGVTGPEEGLLQLVGRHPPAGDAQQERAAEGDPGDGEQGGAEGDDEYGMHEVLLADNWIVAISNTG